MVALVVVTVILSTTTTSVSAAPSEKKAPPLFYARRFKSTNLEDQQYWNDLARAELERANSVKPNHNIAKNVILFLGDGMSIPTLTASRIYKGQQHGAGGEEGSLFFENFPHVGLSKTYNVDKQVSDSASTATAYLTGVKTNYKTLGVDGSVRYQDCTTINDKNKVYSIVKWAQDAGKRTGVVTSTRVTHATPAATYAHVADRDWESDCHIPEEDKTRCSHVLDIASQLVKEEPGKSINVVMGGGYHYFVPNATETEFDPFDEEWGCDREDGQDLVEVWKQQKKAEGVNWAVARTLSDLQKVDTTNTEFLLGLFANDHLQYEYFKRENALDVPTLAEMTQAAIHMLQQEDKGYFLLVEGGRIDHAHHDTIAHRALDETMAFDQAIELAYNMTNQKDTLIVVTADHAHTMSISGYPSRGQEIVGLAALGDDDLPYTTLMYANGPGYNYQVVGDHVARPNISDDVSKSWDYTQLAAVPRNSETHGGDDVAIYAVGPMAHLFHTLHEQNYIAHAMANSACMGNYTKNCRSGAVAVHSSLSALTFPSLLLSTLLPMWLRH
ncbi:hypothetical protein Pmani_018154 [Petrolisthes manimaculis]|uniref:Alkaline phosphatase n=1 Tax=Petrolisthes manimaculis TaxID=1843537 RepID=A0AAE1PKS3_9EUCA|nr:hypothetical protein Pmani_018154 [Petrolisthes manimaculis]